MLSHRKYINFLLLIIIWINEDTFMFGVNENYAFVASKFILYAVLIVFLLFKNFKRYHLYSIIILLVLFCLILMTALINSDFSGGYIYQVMIFILSYLLVREINFKIFTKLFCIFIYYLSLISIFCYLLVILIPAVVDYFPMISNIVGNRVYNLYLCVIYEGDGYSMIRNTSIFREPGVYMIYVNLAIIFSLFYHEIVNKKYLFIYCIAIITTMSTAGIIITGFILFMSFLIDGNSYSKRDNLFAVVFILLSVAYFIYNKELAGQVFGKLSSSSNENVSSLARVVSLFIPMIIFIYNPLFGCGLKSFTTEFTNYSISYFGIPFLADGTSTNTITNLFATYGFVLGIIFLVGLYRFAKKNVINNNKKIIIILLFIILLAMFSNEDMRYSIIFNMIFFYSFYRNEFCESKTLKSVES